MRRLVGKLALALATAAPLLLWNGTPAHAWGWDRWDRGFGGYGYYGSGYQPFCPPYRTYYYSYRPALGYRPYYGAYWRPRYFTSSYFYRPYRPWGWGGWRRHRVWHPGWHHRGWGFRRAWIGPRWGYRSAWSGGWGRSWGFRGGWGHRGWHHHGRRW